MPRSRIIAGVEIGTSKVAVLVGEVIDGRSLNIIALGQATARGVRKGVIYDTAAASHSVHAALRSAEHNAGAAIESVYLAVTGGHLDGFENSGVVTVEDADNWVSPNDVQRAAQSARAKALPDGRLYLTHVRGRAFLDGTETPHPIKQQGAKLELRYWHIHASRREVENLLWVINGYNDLNVQEVIPGSIASGHIATTPEERGLGALVVDIGAGTTDYALYRKGKVERTGVIPVGGDHLTNDLSMAFRISFKQAESLKLRYGTALLEPDKSRKVMLMGDYQIGDRELPLHSITRVLNLRLGETLAFIKNKLGSAISQQNTPAGVLLTGGTAQIPQIATLGRQIFGVETRVAESPDWIRREDLRSPEFHSVIGLLRFGVQGGALDDVAQPQTKSGFWPRIGQFFK